MELVPASPQHAANKIAPWLPKVLDCPNDDNAIGRALNDAENHLITDGEEVIGWMALARLNRGWEHWTLDIAIRPDRHRKWLTRGLMRQAADIIFRGRDYVVLENSKGAALKFALRVGANAIHIEGKKDTYVLSATSFKEKIR